MARQDHSIIVDLSRRTLLKGVAASAGQQYEDGWDNYPVNPIKSWTKAPPGEGSVVTR